MTKRRRPIRDVLAEEAEHAERAYAEGQIEFRPVGRPPKPVRERAQVYSIRIPLERLEEFRRVAAKRGVQAGVLAREWILERLDDESGALGAKLPMKSSGDASGDASRPRIRSSTHSQRTSSGKKTAVGKGKATAGPAAKKTRKRSP